MDDHGTNTRDGPAVCVLRADTQRSMGQPVRSRRLSESTARMLGESRVKIRHRIAVRVVLMTALIVLRHRISYELSPWPSDQNGAVTIETAPLAVLGSPVVLA